MKRLLLVLSLALLATPAFATWSVVQSFISPSNCNPGSLTCSITVTSTGSGNVIVMFLEVNGVGATATTISAVSGGGTYTLGSTFGCNGFTSQHAIDCAYTFNSTSGSTSISVTRSNATGSPQWKIGGYELAFTNGPPVLDVVATLADPVGSGTHIGPVLSPTGANDVILQGTVAGPLVSSVSGAYTGQFSDHFGLAYLLNSVDGSAVTWNETSPQTGTAIMNALAIREASVTSYPLTITVTGNGTVTSSPAGISCPATCTANFTPATSVTLTESPSTGYAFNGWGGDCTSSGTSTTCPITMNASHAASATFLQNSTAPVLPNFIDNNELTCGISGQGPCFANSPGLAYTPPTYEYLLGSSSWIVGPPPSCSFSLPYALTVAGIQSFVTATEACRTAHAANPPILDIPPGTYSCSSCILIPQTNTTATHATTPIIIRTADWQQLQLMPEPIGAGGMQANVSASTQIGLRNPSLDGQNIAGLAVECPAQSLAGGGLAYQLGMSTICIPAGGFTLANGTATSTTNYNYLQHLVVIQAAGSSAPLIFCTVATGASGAQTCNNPSTVPQFAPDLWHFEGIVFADAPGNTNAINLITISDNGGITTAVSQWASHIHFRRIGLLGDWTSLLTGTNVISNGIAGGSCYYCSVVGSQASQLLRPGAEGHIIGASGNYWKISNDWLEGQSSCIFSGGQSSAPMITPIGSFVGAQDIEQRRTRCTFPLAWLGSPYGPGNVPNANAEWGGAGDNPSQPTTVNVDITGLNVTYGSGSQFHDSASFWPGNNVFIAGLTNGCWDGTKAVKCKLVAAGSWPQQCTSPPSGTNCFPSNPPTQLLLVNPVCNPGCTGATTAALTNVGFILNGSSLVRKNGAEKKSFQRYLMSGNITENVDPSGGQRGIVAAFSNRNTSGGGQGTNYQNTETDLNDQNDVYQNACWDVSMSSKSASSGGNGGGSTSPAQRLSFYNVAHLNITTTNPGCSVVGGTVGMQVNIPFQSWTGTVTENGAGTQATFGSTLGTVTSVDSGAPLVSIAASRNGFSGTLFTMNVASASSNFVVNEYVHFPCSGCAGDPGVTALQNQDYQVTATTSSTMTVDLGSGSSDPGALSGSAKIQGPAGFQTFNIPDGFPVYLTGCANTAFNSPTTSIGPLTIAGGGTAAWTGTWVNGNSTVTFALVGPAANASTTCTLSNVQGSPRNLYVQKNTFITDADSPLGSGNQPSGGGSPYSLNGGIQDNLMLNSGASAGNAGWFNNSATLGEGTVTQAFQFDATTLTASNMLIPRKDSSSAPLYSEYCNNTGVNLTNCTPASSNPTHFYFPFAAPGFYASCLVGFLNSCTGVASLKFSDPHGYGLAATSPYFAAASDGTPIGVDWTQIDAAQTANTYVPMVMGQPVTVAIGPFPDSLQGTPPPPSAPTAPAASAFASLRNERIKASSVTGGTE